MGIGMGIGPEGCICMVIEIGIGSCARAWVASPKIARAAKNHRLAMVAPSN
jgi:hypothetical protein